MAENRVDSRYRSLPLAQRWILQYSQEAQDSVSKKQEQPEEECGHQHPILSRIRHADGGLLINLSTVSTRAPAARMRAESNVLMPGLLRYGDLEEAAGAADAGSYGVCFGVSTFVRVDDRWMAGVNKEQLSAVRVGEAIS